MTIYLRGPAKNNDRRYYGESRGVSAPGDLHDSDYEETGVQLFHTLPSKFGENPGVGSVVTAHADAVIEEKCISYLQWLWGDQENDAPEACTKLKLSQVPHEKIAWEALCDFGLRTVNFHFHESAKADQWDEEREREREKKNAHIKVDDVLRAIEKHLRNLIKKDLIKVTEKDLCKMVHAHECTAVKEKCPAMQNALTAAAKLAHRGYLRAYGGKWGYVSARWQQSDAPGDVLCLRFERYDGKMVVLTAEEIHYHWRCNNVESRKAKELVRSHPVLMLANAWLERNQSA